MAELKGKHEMKGWLKVLYTIFLALLIAFFFGLGVSAFYPGPKEPTFPSSTLSKTDPANYSAEQRQVQADFDAANEKYMKEMKTHNRNASMIVLGLAVLALVVSMVFVSKIFIISDSLLLGGIFTLVYSIILGLTTEDAKYSFVVVTIGLLVTVTIGYLKFIKPRLEK